MNITKRILRGHQFAIATMALLVSGLVLLPSGCGDAEVSTPDSAISVAPTEGQQSDTPVSTADVESLNEELIEAARAGDVGEVQALLDVGANVDATGPARSGTWTYVEAPAITHAVLTDHSDVLELLIASGADLEKAELGYRDTALHTAAHLDNAEIVHILLEHGANPQPISKHWNWETPLHYAAEAGAVDAINALLDEGVDVDVQVGGRRTALMNIVQGGSARVATEVATILLERGADPNLQENDGTTVLHAAASRGNTDVVLLCIDHGAEVDIQDDDGDTALHLAAKGNKADIVVVLIDAGASLDVTNTDGETAVEVSGNDEIADLLRQEGDTE